ncbi:hypothetical protein TL16_g09802 [Triparma laevis f. inornata]|uniref:Uncharacterized protein n=1 Tax=Triparma laevis f. inornata TaxID=1714386 RepID=A0A9W7B558_9STRA|nr:hypothetical protein TL16_g09802 [Triparma laevis f. inornata]
MGEWQSTIGEHGMWLTSLKKLAQLARGEGFNEYFQKQFNGNEEAYLRWKEVFDVLEIGNARDVGPDLPLEQQVLMITKSEDLVKLRVLAKLCSIDFFNDESLSAAVERRILEVFVLAMPPEGGKVKKVRGKKKKQAKKKADPRKLEILALVRLWGWRVIGLGTVMMQGDTGSERRRGTRSS